MVVDPRRDHSFRFLVRIFLCGSIRPMSVRTAMQTSRLAGRRTKCGNGTAMIPRGYQDYAETLHAARMRAKGAEPRLIALLREKDQPAIARATAASELSQWLSGTSLPALADAFGDADPQVRAAAVEALASLPPEQLWHLPIRCCWIR